VLISSLRMDLGQVRFVSFTNRRNYPRFLLEPSANRHHDTPLPITTKIHLQPSKSVVAMDKPFGRTSRFVAVIARPLSLWDVGLRRGSVLQFHE
jgi:hypothetical protein